MIISELNYLEVQETEVFGGNGGYRRPSYPGLNTFYKKHVDVKENYFLHDIKVIGVVVDIWGNAATANAGAEAYGYNSDAQTYTASHTTDYSSAAISSSISATK